MAVYTWPSIQTTSGALQYLEDGILTSVSEDTLVEANSKPLPVKLMGVNGPINITAGDLNVQLSDQGANADSVRIGDGTNRLGITASNEAKVYDASQAAAMTTLNAKDFATSAKQDSLITALGLQAKLTDTQPVSAASLPLPTGAATSANQTAQSTLFGAVTETAPASDTSSSGLNGRLQRVAQRITSLIALFPASLGIKTASASFPVVLASDQTLPLPTGAATETTLSAASAKLPATLGQKTSANSMAVVMASDQSTIPVKYLTASTSSVTSVASSTTSSTLLASTANRRQAMIFNDSTATLYLKFGATASSSSYTVQLASGGYFELPQPCYTGVIDGIWSAANGSARITEVQ